MNLVDVVPYGVYEEFGCNFMYEWRSVDHTVCYDHQVIRRIPITAPTRLWCKRSHTRPHWHPVPQPFINQHVSDSGLLAVDLAMSMGSEMTWIVGCDWAVTDASIQDQSYDFRGYQPAKYTPIKDKWLSQLDNSRVTWVHLNRQPWMVNWCHHDDFLDLSTSSRH